MPNITVLVIEPSKKPYVKVIADTLASLQHEVGGHIQAVYPWADAAAALVCDEESKLKGSPFNRALRDESGVVYDYIAGTFIIVGLSEDSFASLSPELIAHFSELFSTPEALVNLGGQLIILPVD